MTFADDINELLADAYRAQIEGTALDAGPTRTYELTIEKTGCIVPVSLDLAMDYGLITEEEARARGWEPYVPPPIPWHARLRWRIAAWRMRFGRRVGSWIAGERLYNDDEMADYIDG